MASIHIEALNCDMAPQACRVLAQAFVTNPLNIAAFGPFQLARNEAFFRVGLAAMKGTKLVVTDGSEILGLIHWVHSPACQFSGLEKLRMGPAMVKGIGLGPALRVGSWQSTWSKHDPSRPHAHLGPLGVSPEVQGQHTGHRLMEHYCEALDRTGDAGYLETDRPENVNFIVDLVLRSPKRSWFLAFRTISCGARRNPQQACKCDSDGKVRCAI